MLQNTLVQEEGGWKLLSVLGQRSMLGLEGSARRVAEWSVRLRRRAPALALAAGAVLAAAALLLLAAALLPPAARAPLCCAACFTTALWFVLHYLYCLTCSVLSIYFLCVAAMCLHIYHGLMILAHRNMYFCVLALSLWFYIYISSPRCSINI